MSVIKTLMMIMSLVVALHNASVSGEAGSLIAKQQISVSKEEGSTNVEQQEAASGEAEILNIEQQILDLYEELGITAFETEDRIDMVNSSILTEALNRSGSEESTVTVFGISDTGNIVRYTFNFKMDGSLLVNTHAMTWRNLGSGTAAENALGHYDDSYVASNWSFTENGYFFVQREFTAGWDGPSEQLGIRVLPVDETYRDYNNKYVLPIGFKDCDLLKTNWGPDNYSGINIWRTYERLFVMEKGISPDSVYAKAPSAITGDVHGDQEPVLIPDEAFEGLMQKYFDMDRETLRELTGYNEKGGYYFEPISFDEVGGAYSSTPEVAGYEENPNGSTTLIINEVDKQEACDRVSQARLTISIFEDGSWKYLSNQVE